MEDIVDKVDKTPPYILRRIIQGDLYCAGGIGAVAVKVDTGIRGTFGHAKNHFRLRRMRQLPKAFLKLL
jgi:hypothetical protein